IAIEIVEHLAADAIRGEEIEVAEVHSTDRGATADRDIDWVGRGAHKVGRHHLPDAIGAGGQVGEAEVTIDIAYSAGLTYIERAIVIGVQEDRNALQSLLDALPISIAIEIVEHLATDAIRREEAEVAEVHPRDGGTTADGDIARIGRGTQ